MCELFERGCWPLRHGGVKVLELGSGPGPGIYGASAFSRAVARWPGGRARGVQPVTVAHALDRGEGWAPFLHTLSEFLLAADRQWAEGGLPFHIEHAEFAGFDIGGVHRRRVDFFAHQIYAEHDAADEPISMAQARRYAQESGGGAPSAYDLILAPNFLTQVEMVDRMEGELRSAMNSLTPGGVFLVMCAHGDRYEGIRQRVTGLAASVGLRTVLDEVRQSHSDPAARATVGTQVTTFVRTVLDACDEVVAREVAAELPKTGKLSSLLPVSGAWRSWTRDVRAARTHEDDAGCTDDSR